MGRAGAIITCLFLSLFLPGKGVAQEWVFDSLCQEAYNRILDLRTDEVLQLLPQPQTPQERYIVTLAEALDLLVTEDAARFSRFEQNFQRRTEKANRSSDPHEQYVQAEMRLHWALIYLKFGHELDAALQLRQSFLQAKACIRDHPEYRPIHKTMGVLNIVLGSVPEKYGWVMALLGLKGSVQEGLAQLATARKPDDLIAFEATLLYTLIRGFVLQETDNAYRDFEAIHIRNPDRRLLLFLGAALAIKDSRSENARKLLGMLDEKTYGLPLPYANYLLGEVFLHKGEYEKAIAAYRRFIRHYPGQNFVKDAHFKIGLCRWLDGKKIEALAAFETARTSGKELAEADKSAARSLSSNRLPHIDLSKVRYFTDGGYYHEADKLLGVIASGELPDKHDQVEYFYRKARLSHKTGRYEAAKLFYEQTIAMAGKEDWYFAPNACLQMGYLLLQEGRTNDAGQYFRKALSYKKHEYKNSIDSKARAALDQLKRR